MGTFKKSQHDKDLSDIRIPKLRERLIYAYIRKIKRWIFCPACEGKMVLNHDSSCWHCEKCDYNLSVKEFESGYVFWFCDECNSFLNIQSGFNLDNESWICTNCGYVNDITPNLRKICDVCGKVLPEEQTLCDDCKKARKEKATQRLKTVGIIFGTVAAVVAGIAYVLGKPKDGDSSISAVSLDDLDTGGKEPENKLTTKYIVEMRSTYDDSLIEVDDDEEFDSYEDAEQACNVAYGDFAEGAETLELCGRDYIDPDDVYFTVGEK